MLAKLILSLSLSPKEIEIFEEILQMALFIISKEVIKVKHICRDLYKEAHMM
jgi:hypothetical protein